MFLQKNILIYDFCTYKIYILIIFLIEVDDFIYMKKKTNVKLREKDYDCELLLEEESK